MTALALALPWLVLAFVALPMLLWKRPRLQDYKPVQGPRVSIIIPARNEAGHLPACLAGILDTSYHDVEIVIVDDRSGDGTLEFAEALAEKDERVRVVRGEALPDGWIGKPWACWQGYRAARGDILVFTDADTRHASDLVARTVAVLEAEGADMVSVLPRQLMVGFWERLILPQVWFVINARHPLVRNVNRADDPRDVIANGQFIMIRREAYEAMGGHEAVRDAVVEDIRLAQRVVEVGRRLFVVFGEAHIRTRMYDSLAAIIEGWTKNVALGARLSVGPRLKRAVPWIVMLIPAVLWILPPLAFGLSFGVADGILRQWALIATAASVLFWAGFDLRHRVPLVYVPLYPLGAAFATVIFVRSALRGERVIWKGRRYGA